MKNLFKSNHNFLNPYYIIPNLFAGFTLAILNITFAISLAAFIFTGDLAKYTPTGTGLILSAMIITGIIIALFSSIQGVISTPKASICAIVALMATSIAGNSAVLPHQVLPTITAAIIVSSIVTGVFLFALGFFRIGNYFRFIPYPVVGGYFAGTGLLIVKGSFSTMLDMPLTIANLQKIISVENLILWLPGVLFALVLYTLMRKRNHYLLIPGMILISIALFYITLMIFDIPVDKARSMGLLPLNFSDESLFIPLKWSFFQQMNFDLLSLQFGNILVIVFLSIISSLLIISVIEISTEKNINLDRDLKVAGIANIVNGLFGGIVSFHEDIDTVMTYKLGADTRLAGLIYALLCGGALLAGSSIITYCPKPLIGGLLLFLGISILVEWVYDTWFSLPKQDYMLVIIILFVVASFGFLKGVGMGIFIAVIVFVLNYSRINVVKYELTGANHKSKVERAPIQKKILQEKGEQIQILILQGYIFFGTAQRLFDHIKQRISSSTESSIHFLILDFRLVNDIDTSVLKSLTKLKQMAVSEKITLVFTNLNLKIRKQMQNDGYFTKEDKVCLYFSNLDYGLEHCEDNILEITNTLNLGKQSLSQQLKGSFSSMETISRFMDYLDKIKLQKGNFLFRQGETSDSLYFIESGKITILLELEEGHDIRLLSMGGGTVLGEMGLYTKMPRSASAMVDEPVTLYRLSFEAFETMGIKDPEIASSFHHFVVSTLADRIVRANAQIKALIA
jgi:SulP family sulfate permease